MTMRTQKFINTYPKELRTGIKTGCFISTFLTALVIKVGRCNLVAYIHEQTVNKSECNRYVNTYMYWNIILP